MAVFLFLLQPGAWTKEEDALLAEWQVRCEPAGFPTLERVDMSRAATHGARYHGSAELRWAVDGCIEPCTAQIEMVQRGPLCR